MRYRTLPCLQTRVSEIAFGTGDNAGGIVYGEPAEQTALVARALEQGINYFDTSPAYGGGRAELNLGRVLQELSAEDVLVATKVKIMPGELGQIAARTRASIDESLRRLRRERLDVVLIHNPCRSVRDERDTIFVPLTPADILDEVLPELQRAQRAGKIRCLGLACDGVETAAVTPVLETRAFSVVNIVYHLANPSAATTVKGIPEVENFEGMFAAARQGGAAIGVISPLGGGALARAVVEQGASGLHTLSRGWLRHRLASSDSLIQRARHFQFLERPGEQTLPQAAFRFILGDPGVATVIGGFSQPQQMDEICASSEQGPLSGEDLAAIARIHQEGF